jgi:DNA invertase Pin-like site-specific DNA recombinase
MAQVKSVDGALGDRGLRLTAYIRVSTDQQAEKGLGLDIQRRAIRSWARESGHVLTRPFHADEGISGSNGLDARAGLADAFATIRSGHANALVVYRLDRLARDLIVQETLLSELWRMGAVVFSTARAESDYLTDDPRDPSRRLIRQVLGAVAEYEKSLIVLRLRSGRERKRANGGYWGGAPKLGLRPEGKELVVDVDEQKTVDRIIELHVAGHSTRQICRVLMDEGCRTKKGFTTWHSAVVAAIIRREVS